MERAKGGIAWDSLQLGRPLAGKHLPGIEPGDLFPFRKSLSPNERNLWLSFFSRGHQKDQKAEDLCSAPVERGIQQGGGIKMEGKSSYSECELRYIDQGFDPARAAETCAADEGRSSGEQSRSSSQDESKEDFGDDF